MTALLLVRHGPTPWTAERRLQGRTDIDLSPEGRDEAVRLRAVIDDWMPRTAVVSPLARTLSTVSLLSELAPIVDARWAEAGLGAWEGSTPDALGEDYARWRAGRFVPPGGETLDDVRARVAEAAVDAARQPGPVLVVTHGGVIRAALAHFVGLTADRIEPVAAPSLTVIDVVPADGADDCTGVGTGGGAAVGRLVRFNVTG